MLSTGDRPRELHWYHAGPMLFGDWGTSRLYVLGLAYAFTGRASFWFIAAMCGLMIGVGWSYEIICRLFPDGGGVYSSARHRSQLLAVIGGLLLCADYVVTASMSCLDAFHYLDGYLGLEGIRWLGLPVNALLTALTILAIGALNYLGPSKTGTIAMIVALATVVLTLVIGLWALFGPSHLTLAAMKLESPFTHGYWNSWVGFTEIVLALSGVEAIANMTGIMVPPVERTARRAILPVLVEIVLLNLILAAAMNAMPDSILDERLPDGSLAHTADMLKVIALHYVGPIFSNVSAVVFAALLLSAVNTALADLVSIQFMLSRDKELPHAFSGLNKFGMPVLPLVVGSVVPALVVLLFPDVEQLAGLYAIGVVGAISINLATTSTNRALALKDWERAFMFGLTLVMIAIGATICVVKPHARSFALLVLVIGLAGRLATIVLNKAVPLSRKARIGYMSVAVGAIVAEFALAIFLGGEIVTDRVARHVYPAEHLFIHGWKFRDAAGKEVELRVATLGKTPEAAAPAAQKKADALAVAGHLGRREGEPTVVPYLKASESDRSRVIGPDAEEAGTLTEPRSPGALMAFGLSIGVAVIVGYASYRTQGYRAALIEAEHHPAVPTATKPKRLMLLPGAYAAKERLMVATWGNPKLIDFAMKECKSRQAELQLLCVRHLAFMPMGPTPIPTLDEDEQALELFDRVRQQAKEGGIPLRLLYGVAHDIPDAILDMAVTHGADMLLLGLTRRGSLWKAMKGDVIQGVAEQLPDSIGLLIHA